MTSRLGTGKTITIIYSVPHEHKKIIRSVNKRIDNPSSVKEGHLCISRLTECAKCTKEESISPLANTHTGPGTCN